MAFWTKQKPARTLGGSILDLNGGYRDRDRTGPLWLYFLLALALITLSGFLLFLL